MRPLPNNIQFSAVHAKQRWCTITGELWAGEKWWQSIRFCVFGGLCVDTWRLVIGHQWLFLLFDCFWRLVQCWYSLVMLHVFPVMLQETRATLQYCTNSVPIVKNSQTAKMTIGVPIVTSTQSPPNTQSRLPSPVRLSWPGSVLEHEFLSMNLLLGLRTMITHIRLPIRRQQTRSRRPIQSARAFRRRYGETESLKLYIPLCHDTSNFYCR